MSDPIWETEQRHKSCREREVALTAELAALRDENKQLLLLVGDMQRELNDILDWHKTEKTMLRTQELKSISALIDRAAPQRAKE